MKVLDMFALCKTITHVKDIFQHDRDNKWLDEGLAK